ncbi:MAG: recombination regulator RecX [Rhizobiaceae bacterium]|nr:recombination regulator RecX [Rhizobiaceae bacterium]
MFLIDSLSDASRSRPDEGTDRPADADAPAPPTPRMLAWARNSAIYRLERQMLTEKQLFDAICRKAKEKFDAVTETQARACAEFAVGFAHANRALDDTAYAGIATRSGVRSGRSRRAIAQRLAIKGIDRETALAALEDADDLYAAVVLARKRAFGPFRRAATDDRRVAREMAAFARGGFGFDLARKVLAMDIGDAGEILASRRI